MTKHRTTHSATDKVTPLTAVDRQSDRDGSMTPGRRRLLLASGLLGLAGAAGLSRMAGAQAMAGTQGMRGAEVGTTNGTQSNSRQAAASDDALLYDWGPAPELVGLGPWFNSPPLTLAALRGQVVLVDFWTHGCINCLRTLPHVRRWAERHRDAGLVVIGVHSPEFAYERSPARVQTAIRRFGIGHPVALDNDHATWKAWANPYWPAHYLVDRAGRIRYRHFGEGDYDRTEAAILALLR